MTRAELIEKWERGWTVLQDALNALGDADLQKTVTIRGQTLLVHEALHVAPAPWRAPQRPARRPPSCFCSPAAPK